MVEHKLGRWLSNHSPSGFDQNPEATVVWLSDKLIGPPKGTDTYTADELVRMGMVGVYAKPEGETDG